MVAGYAQMLMLAGQSADSRACAESVLDVAREIGARGLEGHLRSTLAAALAYGEDAERAVTVAEEALAIAEETGAGDDLGRAYAAITCALDFAGRRAEEVEIGLEGAVRLKQIGMGAAFGEYVLMNAVSGLIALGRWNEALEHLRGAEARTAGTSRLFVLQVLAQLLVRRGDLDGTLRALDAADAFVGDEIEAQFTGPISVARIMYAQLVGDVAAGRRVVDRILPILEQTDDLPRQMDLLLAAIRLEADEAERARATRNSAGLALALERAGRFGATLRSFQSPPGSQARYLAWIVALAAAEETRIAGTPDPACWRRALDEGAVDGHAWDALYTQFRLAEALLAGRSGREEAAVTLGRTHAIAASLGARPLRESIEALARRARIPLEVSPAASSTGPAGSGPWRQVSRLPVPAAGANVPGTAPGANVPGTAPGANGHGSSSGSASGSAADAWRATATYGLTGREVEVLLLLALGRTNRQIGDELFIAEGTAGVHVSNIIRKLDVGNRVEAATIAARMGLGAGS